MAKGFKNLSRDGSNAPMQVADQIETSDATATAVTSPVAYTNANTKLTVPTRATELIIWASTALRISEETDPAGGNPYYVLQAGVIQVFPVSGVDAIYLTRDSASGNANFYFHLV